MTRVASVPHTHTTEEHGEHGHADGHADHDSDVCRCEQCALCIVRVAVERHNERCRVARAASAKRGRVAQRIADERDEARTSQRIPRVVEVSGQFTIAEILGNKGKDP